MSITLNQENAETALGMHDELTRLRAENERLQALLSELIVSQLNPPAKPRRPPMTNPLVEEMCAAYEARSPYPVRVNREYMAAALEASGLRAENERLREALESAELAKTRLLRFGNSVTNHQVQEAFREFDEFQTPETTSG